MNSVVYDLIHCTGHHLGFDLFKEIAWKTFNDKSSDKHVKTDDEGYEQMCIDFSTGELVTPSHVDESRYTLKDAALYLQKHFKGQVDVPKDDVFDYLAEHPVFPTRNYRKKICAALKEHYNAAIHQKTITFSDWS